MIRFIALLLCLMPSMAFAQIDLSYVKAKSIVGATSPRIAGDRILIAADSKPQVVTVAIITVKSKPGELVSVFAWKSMEEEAELIQLSPTEFMLAGEGRYLVHAISVSSKANKWVEVDASPVDPEPDPPVDPLAGLSKESRDAVVGFVQGMGSDFEKLAEDAKSGKVKTVLEASAANNNADQATRAKFKESMGKIMAPKLGTGQLPADAPQTFQSIAKGFKAVK